MSTGRVFLLASLPDGTARVPPPGRGFPRAQATRHVLTAAGLVLALATCDHSSPFAGATGVGADTTFRSGSPRRLTYNQGTDLTPAWTSDGSTILYSAEDPTSDRDRCLTQLPGTGGTIRSALCGMGPYEVNTTDVWSWPAATADGRLLYTRVWSTPGAISPDSGVLDLATVSRPAVVLRIRGFPYTAPSGQIHQGISNVVWLAPDAAVYIGDRIDYPRACSSCAPDTLVTGLELMHVGLSGASPTITPVPGTDGITSVAPAGSNAVMMTTQGSPVVTQLGVMDGGTFPIHNFGADGIARDIQRAGSLLVAVVGGKVTFGIEPVLGPVQRDAGGVLHVVELLTGADQAMDVPGILFRHPALRPDGRALVAEGYHYRVDSLFVNNTLVSIDTTVSPTSDLWLFDLP